MDWSEWSLIRQFQGSHENYSVRGSVKKDSLRRRARKRCLSAVGRKTVWWTLETGEAAEIRSQLGPVTPAMIWCVGQNYRRHADEVGMGFGAYPVVFTKGVNTGQDPGGPILGPARAKTSQMD